MLHGTWTADPTHSSLSFAIRHMRVATFRGELRDFEATLEVRDDTLALRGRGRVASISTPEAVVARQLLAGEFFDEAGYPEIRLDGGELRWGSGGVSGEGELTIRGVSRAVELSGTLAGPVVDPFGSSRLGLDLAATIDRREWGLRWNAPLPGGGLVLANAVAITAHLELVRSRGVPDLPPVAGLRRPSLAATARAEGPQ